jgi:hypothetical protein
LLDAWPPASPLTELNHIPEQQAKRPAKRRSLKYYFP